MDDATRIRIEDGERCLEEALYYLSIGLSVLPLCYPDHVGIRLVSRRHSDQCSTPGKRPWIEWAAYEDKLPTEADLHHWWHQLPSSNVGAAMGPVSSCIRVDVDSAAAEEALRRKSDGLIPDTWEFTSGRTDRVGRGLLYSIPDGVVLRTTRGAIDRNQELRFQAKGAQTVLPPSRHYKGTLYTWTEGHSPREMPRAMAPPWLVAELAATAGNGHASKSRAEWQEAMAGAAEGSRNSNMASLIGKMLCGLRDVENESDVWMTWLATEAINERNEPPLDDDELYTVFQSILKSEKRNRLRRDATALNRFIEETAGRSVEISRQQASGDPVTERPPWHLVIIHSDPLTYRLRAPFWCDHPAFIATEGHVFLTHEQIYTWGGRGKGSVPYAVHSAGGPSDVVSPLKQWHETLEKLKETADHEEAQPENCSLLSILAFIYRYLAPARPLHRSEKGAPLWAKMGTPTKIDNGTILFKLANLSERAGDAHVEFKQKEWCRIMTEAGFIHLYPDNTRWWAAEADTLRKIGLETHEIQQSCASNGAEGAVSAPSAPSCTFTDEGAGSNSSSLNDL